MRSSSTRRLSLPLYSIEVATGLGKYATALMLDYIIWDTKDIETMRFTQGRRTQETTRYASIHSIYPADQCRVNPQTILGILRNEMQSLLIPVGNTIVRP